MIIDKQLLVEEDFDIGAANLTVAGSPYESSDAIDLEDTPPRQIGDGKTVKMWFQVTETFVGAGASLQVGLVESSLVALTGGTTNLLDRTEAIPVASLVAGYQRILKVPVEILSQRYLGIQLVVAGATLTDGAWSAGIVCDEQTSKTGWPAQSGFGG